MLGMIVWGMTSCNDENNAPVFNPDKEYLKNFSVEAGYETPNNIDITVTSANKSIHFITVTKKYEYFEEMTKENALENMIKEHFKDSKFPDGLHQDSYTFPFSPVKPRTKYVIFILPVGEGYNVQGNIEYKFLETPKW